MKAKDIRELFKGKLVEVYTNTKTREPKLIAKGRIIEIRLDAIVVDKSMNINKDKVKRGVSLININQIGTINEIIE